MTALVECNHVSFTYASRQEPSLIDINLTIETGDFIVCTGPTGCGKSTLLKMFNGLIPHEISGTLDGSVLIAGLDSLMTSVADLSRVVSLMFQNPDDQIFSTSIADEISFAMENMGLNRAETERRIVETLAWVGLSGREKQSVHALSGGERQRLALAAVLAMRPRLLALDEPISQMDPRGAYELLQVLQQLNEQQGITILVVEHRLHEVMPVCKRVWVMEQGRMVWQGTRQEAFRSPEVFLQLGLRIPQPVHVCYGLGLCVEDARLESAAKVIRTAYPTCIPRSDERFTPQEPKIDEDVPLLQIEKLEFRYDPKGRKILDQIDLNVYQGQFVALMGNNGAGKSTLLHHVCGLQRSSAGRVVFAGREVQGLDRRIGMVMQNPDLMLFNTTVEKEIRFGLVTAKGEAGPNDSLQQLIERIGLAGMEKNFPLALSQGQRVRVAIAALLACSPALLLLDEPTTGQDLGHIGDIIDLLQDYTRRGGTVILCTHDTEVAARYAERVIVMTEGKVIANASPRHVFLQEEVMQSASLRPPAALKLSRLLYGGSALGVEEVIRDVQQTSLVGNAG